MLNKYKIIALNFNNKTLGNMYITHILLLFTR